MLDLFHAATYTLVGQLMPGVLESFIGARCVWQFEFLPLTKELHVMQCDVTICQCNVNESCLDCQT